MAMDGHIDQISPEFRIDTFTYVGVPIASLQRFHGRFYHKGDAGWPASAGYDGPGALPAWSYVARSGCAPIPLCVANVLMAAALAAGGY